MNLEFVSSCSLLSSLCSVCQLNWLYALAPWVYGGRDELVVANKLLGGWENRRAHHQMFLLKLSQGQ